MKRRRRERPVAEPLPGTGKVLGFDRGVYVVAATSAGELIRNGHVIPGSGIAGFLSLAKRGAALFCRQLRFEETADFDRYIEVLVESGAPDALLQRAGDVDLERTSSRRDERRPGALWLRFQRLGPGWRENGVVAVARTATAEACAASSSSRGIRLWVLSGPFSACKALRGGPTFSIFKQPVRALSY